MELYRLDLSYWVWIALAAVLAFAAVIAARRKQPFYGRLLGAGLLLLLPLSPVAWLRGAMVIPAVMMLVMTLDFFIDRSQKPIARALFGGVGVVLFLVLYIWPKSNKKSARSRRS